MCRHCLRKKEKESIVDFESACSIAVEDDSITKVVEKGLLLDNIENEHLKTAIKRLSEKELRILEMRIFKKLKHKEIALLLNMSAPAVGKSYQRVLLKLKKTMEELTNG